MPNYLYNCSKCSSDIEMIKKISDRHSPEGEECPKCKEMGGVKMRITAPPIVDSFRVGVSHAPIDFRKHVLGKIQEAHPKGNISSRTNIPKEI